MSIEEKPQLELKCHREDNLLDKDENKENIPPGFDNEATLKFEEKIAGVMMLYNENKNVEEEDLTNMVRDKSRERRERSSPEPISKRRRCPTRACKK
jgi:hypothetical protein